MSETVVQEVPVKTFHVALLSNEIKQFIEVSSGLVYKTFIFSNLLTGIFLKLLVSSVSTKPAFRS